jgi:hypothetical protein
LSAESAGMYPGDSDYVHISPVTSFVDTFQPKNRELPGRPWKFPENAVAEFTLQRPLALVPRDLETSSIRLEDYVVGLPTP